ncbi:MAG: acyltransferase [Gammaproteobacteria bacterium]|nr:acyltransferase [Gammaproteobacteria bacterium]
MDKIKNIQSLRGIAVLLVVLFHLLNIEQKYGGSEHILPNFFQFGMFGVDLFFVISGFVMVAITRGKFQVFNESLKFLYHRIARIYPLYWIYTSLLFIVFFLQPMLINNAQGNQVDILSSFLLIPSHILPLVVVGWSLIHEMYFYIIFFLILLLIPEKYLRYMLLIWGFFVLIMNNYWISNNPIIQVISHPLTFEFLGGCFIAIFYFQKEVHISNKILLILTLFSITVSLLSFLYYQKMTASIIPLGWWRIIIFGLPALLLVYCAIIAEKNGYIIHSSLLLIGNASYSIYLSHVLTLSVFGRIWSLFSIDSIIDNIIIIPILIILVLGVGFLSYLILEKPLFRLSRHIIQ